MADNSVTLSNFNFGGGNPAPPADYLGTTGVSGDLSSTVTMDDSGFTALFAEEFNPGTSVSFLLNISNSFAGGTPDGFAMYVCDTALNCYSDDTNTQAMLVLGLTGTPLTPSSFTLNAASAQGLPAPVVTVANGSGSTATPEPSNLLLLLVGVVALLVGSNWRNRVRAAS